MTLIVFTSLGVAASYIIIQKPIDFGQTRVQLTQQYRWQHYGVQSAAITIVPQMIVLHWTARATLKEAYDFFYPPTLSQRPDIAGHGLLNVTAQYLVDRDGTIYQLMPDNWMARHVIGLNDIAIGIENVGGVDDVADLTPAQVDADVYLIRYLQHKYPTIHYLIGHYEYLQCRHTPLWQEKDDDYITFKQDPGPAFMRAVRKKVADLKLASCTH